MKHGIYILGKNVIRETSFKHYQITKKMSIPYNSHVILTSFDDIVS